MSSRTRSSGNVHKNRATVSVNFWLARGTLDVRLHPFVAGLTPVGLRYTQDLSDVPTGMVIGVERRVPVLGRPTNLEVGCGGRYGVLGVHYVCLTVPVAVCPILFPGRRQELHRAHSPGAGGAHVLPVVRLGPAHSREHVPVFGEPVPLRRRFVDLNVPLVGYRLHRACDDILHDLELLLYRQGPPTTRRRPRERPSLLRGLQLRDPRLHQLRPQPQLADRDRQPRLTPPQLLGSGPPLFPQLLVLRPLLVQLPFGRLHGWLGVAVLLWRSAAVAEDGIRRAGEIGVLVAPEIQK